MNAVNVRLVNWPGGAKEMSVPPLHLAVGICVASLTTRATYEDLATSGEVETTIVTVPIKKWTDGHRYWFQADYEDAQ